MDVNQNIKDILWDTPMDFDSDSDGGQETDSNLGILERQKISGIALWAFRRFFKTPENNEPHVEEIFLQKVDECVKVTFTWKDDTYPIFISNDLPKKHYPLSDNEFEVPVSPMYHELRGRLLCLPQTLKIRKLKIENSEGEKLEDVFLEVVFLKKWICETLEYNITRPFGDSYVLFRLLTNFKPSIVIVQLQYGQHYFHKSGHASRENHFHVVTHNGNMSRVEADTNGLMAKYYDKPEYEQLLFEIGKALIFGHNFRKTIHELKKFTDHLLNIFSPKKFVLRKFILKCPSGDVDCGDFRKMWRSEKVRDFENNDKIFLCVQRDGRVPEKHKYSLSMEVSRLLFPMKDKEFLKFTKTVPFINIGFRVDISEDAVAEFIQQWQKGERDVEEVRLRLQTPLKADSLSEKVYTELYDLKWIKVRRVLSGMKRKTLYVCRESMSHRILYIKCKEPKVK